MVAKEEETKEEVKAEEKKEEDVEMKSEDAVKEEVKEELAEETPEEPKEPEKPKELEEDAAADKRPRIKAGAAELNMADSTLNVLPVAGSNLLMTLSEGGFQYLLASTRASVGVKAGRYMFEVKIVESLNPSEEQTQARTPQPRQLVRVGVSLAGSSLFLADGPANVSFDSEGYFTHEKSRKKVGQKFGRGQTVGVLLNLDASSPNANTISLFRDGVRVAEPQALPECLRGQALYPTITYKNVTLQVHFGPPCLFPLPFKCRMLADAATADVEVAKAGQSQSEVVFPVGLPEQGFFDWVDRFVEKNPGFTEISDRKILDWASKSGIWRRDKGSISNDTPGVKFGIPSLDDGSVRKILSAIAPVSNRSYIIPTLQSNLVPAERKASLAKFALPGYKKKAIVVMGEPNADYKESIQKHILAAKQQQAEVDKKKKAQELERKRLLDNRKKIAEEAKKAKEAKQRLKDGKEAEEEVKPSEEATKEEDKKEKEEDKKEEDVAMDSAVELTEDDKQMWYRKLDTPDLTDNVIATTYARFALPTADEGFDSVTFEWQPESACAALLKTWIMEKKTTQRVEDIVPGEWFKSELAKWHKAVPEWKKRLNDWKNPTIRKALLAKKAEAAKKEKAEEKKEGAEEGEEKEGEEKKEAEEKEEEKEEATPMEINADDLDVFEVQDVMDIGNGEPLFSKFGYEDWTLLSLRYELYLMLLAWNKDLNDPDRPSFGETHFPFYYNKYFKKTFELKNFGKTTYADLVELVKDTVAIDAKTSFFSLVLPEDTPLSTFVQLAEEHRRERARRIDAGDETANLKFVKAAAPPVSRPVGNSALRPVGQATRPLTPRAPQSQASVGRPRPPVSVGSLGRPRPPTPVTYRPSAYPPSAPKGKGEKRPYEGYKGDGGYKGGKAYKGDGYKGAGKAPKGYKGY